MTPFGERLRQLRAARGVTQRDMAAAIGVSPAYLSALEHGRRGAPNWATVQNIIGYFNVIWDEAEELERLAGTSHPRVVVDTAGLSPQTTQLANMLAANVARLSAKDAAALCTAMEEMLASGRAGPTETGQNSDEISSIRSLTSQP